jgi:hypothetical protein
LPRGGSTVNTEYLLVALSFFCLAGACLFFFWRSGKSLKKMKAKLDEIGKGLEEPPAPEGKK